MWKQTILKELGLKRVVLSRELSFEDIKSIKEKSDIELEIFVSGALMHLLFRELLYE